MPLRVKKKNAARVAPTGSVTSQETTIVPTTLRSMAPRPLARPTPITAPTAMWVVDTGRPVRDATTTVDAAASREAVLEAARAAPKVQSYLDGKRILKEIYIYNWNIVNFEWLRNWVFGDGSIFLFYP